MTAENRNRMALPWGGAARRMIENRYVVRGTRGSDRARKGAHMKLANWNMERHELLGDVYGSRRYPDGTYIHTSPVVTAVYDDGLFLFRTENSVYECRATDFAGTEVELNLLIENAVQSDRQTTARIKSSP